MIGKSRKPLIIPILMTIVISSVALMAFFSVKLIQVELPPQPEIRPNLSRNGSSYSGFIDILIPLNISNLSPASLRNVDIYASMSIVSIENFGLFPDTTIVNITERITSIDPDEIVQVVLNVNISSWISILAVFDAYLVLDFDINLDYYLGPLYFPVHLVGRLQDVWEAPFSL